MNWPHEKIDADDATRDTFAAAALTGCLTYPGPPEEHSKVYFAKAAYDYADAMMTERARRSAQRKEQP